MVFLEWGRSLRILTSKSGLETGFRGLKMTEKRDFRNFFGPKAAIEPFSLDIEASCGYSKMVFADLGGTVRRIPRRAVANEKLVVFRPQAECDSRLG